MTKIAIIEDDQVINQMYRMKFEAAGFDVATASDGEAGEEEAPDGLRKLGVHSYIVKADFTPRQVVERVKHALNIR